MTNWIREGRPRQPEMRGWQGMLRGLLLGHLDAELAALDEVLLVLLVVLRLLRLCLLLGNLADRDGLLLGGTLGLGLHGRVVGRATHWLRTGRQLRLPLRCKHDGSPVVGDLLAAPLIQGRVVVSKQQPD